VKRKAGGLEMRQETDQAAPGLHPSPIVHRKGAAYCIDNRLQEFRVVSRTHLRCIGFGSEVGRDMLADCTLVDCPNCGRRVVFPGDATEGIAACRCGERVSLGVGGWVSDLDR
jgi:hypothetical protein